MYSVGCCLSVGFINLKPDASCIFVLKKVLRGALPCRGTLADRHIPTSAQCPVCRIGFEDSQHCLFTCKRALDIWTELGVKREIQRSVLEDRSGAITMDTLMGQQTLIGEIPMAELVAVASWYIWWQRRQLVKGEPVRPPDCTAVSIKVLATNFVRASTPNRRQRQRDHMWRKPTRGSVKINVDATFCGETMKGATGAVARDDQDGFIAAASWFIPHVQNAEAAEIAAIRNGFYLAAKIGCNSVIVESDSMNTIEATNQHEYLGPETAIISESKSLGKELSKADVVHCFRKANSVADSIAKHSLSIRASEVWESSTPDFISHLIVNDLSII